VSLSWASWILAAGRTGRYYPAWVLWRTPESRELQILVEGRSDLLFAPSQRGPGRLGAGRRSRWWNICWNCAAAWCGH